MSIVQSITTPTIWSLRYKKCCTIVPKMSLVMTTVAPAHISNLVLFTRMGSWSLTGRTWTITAAGTLVLVRVLATRVKLSESVSCPLWIYWKKCQKLSAFSRPLVPLERFIQFHQFDIHQVNVKRHNCNAASNSIGTTWDHGLLISQHVVQTIR